MTYYEGQVHNIMTQYLYACKVIFTISLIPSHHHTKLQKTIFLSHFLDLFQQLSNMQYTVTDYSPHAVYYSPLTDLKLEVCTP